MRGSRLVSSQILEDVQVHEEPRQTSECVAHLHHVGLCEESLTMQDHRQARKHYDQNLEYVPWVENLILLVFLFIGFTFGVSLNGSNFIDLLNDVLDDRNDHYSV